MNTLFRLIFFAVCASLIFGVPVFAADSDFITPPSASDNTTQSVVNGFVQIQAQLHDTQLAIADSAADSKRNADALTARIQTLEDNLATQRVRDMELALMLAIAFGLILVAAMLFMAYLQWRAVARLVELSALRPQELSLNAGRAAPPLMSNAVVEESNARLSGAVELLRKRIWELEQNTRAPLTEKIQVANGSHPGSHPKPDPNNGNLSARDREECVANLLTEGQTLLDAHAPEKALECFEIALGLEPNHGEALVKKGGALEKLGRTDEAIACYDRAIAADEMLTIAHLHKGGLFNRLARYDEALKCYEQALRTQEKKMPREKIAA